MTSCLHHEFGMGLDNASAIIVGGCSPNLQEGKQKQPYSIYRDGQEVLHMAGLFDVWKGAEGEPMFSFTILTTDSSERLAW